MNHIYKTAEAALSSDALGSKTLTTLEAALELTGKPAKDVEGRDGYYSVPIKAVDGFTACLVLPLPGNVDGLGRPIVDGLLADRDAVKAKYKIA